MIVTSELRKSSLINPVIKIACTFALTLETIAPDVICVNAMLFEFFCVLLCLAVSKYTCLSFILRITRASKHASCSLVCMFESSVSCDVNSLGVRDTVGTFPWNLCSGSVLRMEATSLL